MENNLARVAWRKSSHSGGAGNCVEVGGNPGAVGVRDTKDPDGPALILSPRAWQAFVGHLKRGELD
jgi:Domain of unknown function (DUF397)